MRVEIRNQGTASSQPVKVRLELHKPVSPGLVDAFWYCQMTVKGLNSRNGDIVPTELIQMDFILPVGVKPSDVGPVNPYWLEILGPPDDSNQDNNLIFSSEPLPLLSVDASPPVPPPDPWQLSASAIVGKRKSVVAHIKNDSIKPSTAKTVQLHLRIPKPGSPAGTLVLSGSAPVPALHPTEEVLVTIAGDRNFIVPLVKIVKHDGVISKKKNLTRKFKTLIPFSLKIKGAGSEVGYGSIAGAEGQIKFPGKK
jgi:hypothetical protein